jgi:hypothetical protein
MVIISFLKISFKEMPVYFIFRPPLLVPFVFHGQSILQPTCAKRVQWRPINIQQSYRAAAIASLWLLAAVNWHSTTMFFSGVFSEIPKFMARSFLAHGMRDYIVDFCNSNRFFAKLRNLEKEKAP